MASDLFRNLDALFTKQPVEITPPLFIINRFLAWQPHLAPFAAAISRVRNNEMAWEIWRTALPRGSGAPRCGYPAPKVAPAAEKLVVAILERSRLGREDAELTVELATASGQLEDLLQTYGVEA